MRKSSLTVIFASLPKDRQQEAILDCLEKMFARGERPDLLKITAELRKGPADEAIRARALYLDLRCALRLQNPQDALAACEELLELAEAGESQMLACEAICQLAGHLLPAEAGKICSLCQRLAEIPLPPAARLRLVQPGKMLARVLTQNGDLQVRPGLLRLPERLRQTQPHD